MMNRIRFAFPVLFLVGLAFAGLLGRPQASGAATPQAINQFGGAVYDVAVQDSVVYVGVGPRLAVVDVSRPEAPTVLGLSDVLPGVVRRVILDYPYVYVAAGAGGLVVMNVEDAANPMVVGIYETGGYVEDAALAGKYAYVASSPVWDGGQWTGDSVQVVDISSPSSLRQVASYDTPGWSFGVAVSGKRVFVADGDGGLRVLDASQPEALKEVGVFQTVGPAMDVVLIGENTYVADFVQGLSIINVKNANTLKEVAAVATAGQARRVLAGPSYAYVTGGERGLSIVDVSRPEMAREVAAWEQGNARGMAVEGDYLYVADREHGLRILDASGKSSPVQVGAWETVGPMEGVAALQDVDGEALLFVADGGDIQALRVSKEKGWQVMGVYETEGRAVDVAVNTTQAGPGQSYLVAVAEARTWQGEGWSATGVRLYEGDAAQRLQEIGFWPAPGEAHQVDFVDDVLMVAAGSAGLRAVDVSDPRAPREVGRYATGRAVTGVTAAWEGCAYLTMVGQVIDVCLGDATPAQTGPAAPPVPTPNPRASSMQAQGLRPLTRKRMNVAALHYHEGSLYFSDPSVRGVLLDGERDVSGRLRRLASGQSEKSESAVLLDTPGRISDIAILGTQVFVADGDGGMVVFQLGDEPN